MIVFPPLSRRSRGDRRHLLRRAFVLTTVASTLCPIATSVAADLPRPIRSAPELLYAPTAGAATIDVSRLAVADVDGKAIATKVAEGALTFRAMLEPVRGNKGRVTLTPPGAPVTFASLNAGVGFWIDAPAQTCVDFVYKDAAGNTYVCPTFRKTDDGPQYAACAVDDFRDRAVDDDGPMQGGNGGKLAKVALPVELVRIALHAGKQPGPIDATVKIRDLAAVERLDPAKSTIHVELDHGPFANVYKPGDTARGTIRADAGQIEWRLIRHDGKEIASGKGDASVAIALPLEQPGHYVARITNRVDGKLVDARELKLAAIPPATGVAERIGICAHFNREYYGLDGADLLPILAINAVRSDANWNQFEPTPGKLRVPATVDAYLKLSRDRGNRPLFLINGTGKAYGFQIPQKPDEYEKFVAFANFVFDKTAGVVERAEIWNEWSNGTGMPADFKPTPAGYVALVRGIIPGIREHLEKTGNKVELVGLGGENPYVYNKEIAALLATGVGKSFDILSYHPYTNPTGPEVGSAKDPRPLDVVLGELSQTDRQNGGGGRMMITEAGYSTHVLPWGVSERECARQDVRLTALALATPNLDRVYLYSLREENELPIPPRFRTSDQFPQHHYGLFSSKDQGYAPKETAVAIATLARQLIGAGKLTLDRPAKGVYRVSISDLAGRPMRSLWWCDAGISAGVRRQGASARDLLGMPIDAATVPLSPDPVYVDGSGGALGPA